MVSLGQALTIAWAIGRAAVESDQGWLGGDCVMPAAGDSGLMSIWSIPGHREGFGPGESLGREGDPMWGSVHENSEPTSVVDTMPSLHTETRQGCGGARSETDSGTERQGSSLGLLPQNIIGERSMLKALTDRV